MTMLEHHAETAIHWGHGGHTFWLADPVRLEAAVLPTYFKHNRMSFFIKQLRAYGFKQRIGQRCESAEGVTFVTFAPYTPRISHRISHRIAHASPIALPTAHASRIARTSHLPSHRPRIAHRIAHGTRIPHRMECASPLAWCMAHCTYCTAHIASSPSPRRYPIAHFASPMQ